MLKGILQAHTEHNTLLLPNTIPAWNEGGNSSESRDGICGGTDKDNEDDDDDDREGLPLLAGLAEVFCLMDGIAEELSLPFNK